MWPHFVSALPGEIFLVGGGLISYWCGPWIVWAKELKQQIDRTEKMKTTISHPWRTGYLEPGWFPEVSGIHILE